MQDLLTIFLFIIIFLFLPDHFLFHKNKCNDLAIQQKAALELKRPCIGLQFELPSSNTRLLFYRLSSAINKFEIKIGVLFYIPFFF